MNLSESGGVAPAHDEQWHERVQLSHEVVVGVLELLRLVRDDQYLVNVTFCLGRVVGSSASRGIVFLLEPGQKTFFLHPLASPQACPNLHDLREKSGLTPSLDTHKNMKLNLEN